MISRVIISSNIFGDLKLVRLPIRYKSYSKNRRNFKEYDEKLECSISRSRNKVLDYALNNKFKYFCTLTFNDNLDSYNLAQISNFISQRIRDIRKKYKIDLKYVLIPEKHEKGNYHLHGFFSQDFDNCLYRNEHGYLSCEDFDFCGHQSYSIIRDYKACSYYVCKYITKEMALMSKGKHLYFCSKGLNTSKKLYDFVVSGYDSKFDFENDYCSVKNNLNDNDTDDVFKCYYNSYN